MTYWYIFRNDEILLEKCIDGTYTIPVLTELPKSLCQAAVEVIEVESADNGIQIKAVELGDNVKPDCAYEFVGLRASYYKISETHYLKAGKCHELLYWNHNTRYCGTCGGVMKKSTLISKKCTHCGREIWPQLATAIIVLVSRGDEILLVHAHNFKKNFYGLVAGFVETGETLEQAVVREVYEETGLTINNIRYYGSQPWPYPCGLMIGFYADYVQGNIDIQQTELRDGGWYHKDHLPEIPEKLSIARQLIDHWLASFNK